MKQHQGFSLVEIAVVLVVIGLLMGGVLKSQGVIGAMNTKDAMTTLADLQTAIRFFRERYNYLPGDFPISAGANAEITGLTPACLPGGNGDGVISAAESACVPAQLFAAGMIRGGGGPLSSRYGSVRVIDRTLSNLGALPTTVFNVIEMANLPCDTASEIDRKQDDDNFMTGRMRGTIANCAAGATVPFFGTGL